MPEPTSPTKTRHSLWRLLTLLRPKHWKYIAGLSARALLTTTERLFIGYLLKLLIDATIAGDKVQFKNIVVLWICFYLAFIFIAPFILYLWKSAVYEGTANIREAIFKHIQRLPLGYHELHHSGDALSILTNDASAAEKAYQEDLYTLVEASMQGTAAAVLMLYMNWQLALVIIASGLVPMAINALFAGPLRKVGQAVQERLAGVSERMSDLLAGVQVIRTFDLGEWVLARFSQANQQVLGSSLRRVRLESILASSNEVAGIPTFLPWVVGGFMTLIGQTTLGTFMMLLQLSSQTNYFVYSLGGVVSRIQSALAAADRIVDLLDSPIEAERLPMLEAGAAAPQAGAMIAFRDVTFAYNGGENILNALSFEVQRGGFVAFAGTSGGGKSTIFKLLLGCYPVKAGSISVAGRPIQDYLLSELRELVAYVPQDAYLFSGSILENIRYGKPDATPEQVMAAARSAFADDFINEFPEGYQTVVGERGARLSGGQRQRIAIARALLKDAPILLLDEATSALDSESEQVVQQALEVLMQGRTTLVIAHRFSTIVKADQIHVIDSGRVVEQGRHSALLERGGVYARLYETQFQLNQEG